MGCGRFSCSSPSQPLWQRLRTRPRAKGSSRSGTAIRSSYPRTGRRAQPRSAGREGRPSRIRRRSTFTKPLTDARWPSRHDQCRQTTTLRQWATAYVGAAVPSFCTKSRGYRATTLGGVPALAFTGRCEIHDINVELAVRRGRGYTFALASPRADSEAADGAVFEAARRSFRFVR